VIFRNTAKVTQKVFWQYRKSRLNNCHFERSEKSCGPNLPQKISPFGRDDRCSRNDLPQTFRFAQGDKVTFAVLPFLFCLITESLLLYFLARSQIPIWERNRLRNSVSREVQLREQVGSQTGDWEPE
jgi:hypothetical protein